MSDSGSGDEIIALCCATLVAIGAIGFALVRSHRRASAKPTSSTAHDIHVPHASDRIKFDGELDEPSWLASARSEPFVTPDGKEAAPYSDARFAWSDDGLRIGLYAADEDIVSAHVPVDGPVWQGDAFHVVVGVNGVEHVFDVGPTCILTDGERRDGGSIDYTWQSGARLACDADGTIDVAGDRDEEWVVEMEIPLARLGLTSGAGARLDVRIRRCDVRADASEKKACGEMKPATLVLDR